jgi:four helix bundle protein
MEKSKNYKDLIVWQKAIDIAELTYKTTTKFPKEEVYGMTSQMRRSAISIASNIAEGQGRGTVPQFIHFLTISKGSLCELETQLVIALRLGYISKNDYDNFEQLLSEIGRLLNGLLKSQKQ